MGSRFRNPISSPSFARVADDLPLLWNGATRFLARGRILRAERSLLAALVASSDDAIASKTLDGIITSWNPEAETLFGYSAAEAIGQPMTLIFPPDRLDEEADFLARIARGESIKRYETVRVRKDGRRIMVSVNLSPIRDSKGRVIGASKIAHDISLRKKDEEEIRRLAFFDSLTGLPNRRLLLDRLEQALSLSRRTDLSGALLLIDLDQFKTLNDTLGHDIGDELLRQVARRLVDCVRESDSVARLGGDEFVLLLEGLSSAAEESAAQTEAVVTKIFTQLHRPFVLGERKYHTTASIGATLFNGHHESVDDLLKQADLALYRAKDAGRNALRFFDPDMQVAVEARAALESDLREGLSQEDFQLYFQPKVDQDDSVIGVEALIRWNHPERGLVLPGDFIPFAEESGVILPLGRWILAAACEQLAAWSTRPETAHLTLAANVSARQFRRADFVADVTAALEAAGADPRKLILELTESLLLDDLDDVIGKMTALRAIGVGFALDDFGTGYSSLSYLKRLPLTQLKIDRSFVDGLPEDGDDVAITRTILALAQHMGLEVVAEGVETTCQRDFLIAQNCQAFQGFLFGRPAPVAEFEAINARAVDC
jgi:diguanylate cyclase (GGDEF)-like protein/PAS domain S-box-containing protein